MDVLAQIPPMAGSGRQLPSGRFTEPVSAFWRASRSAQWVVQSSTSDCSRPYNEVTDAKLLGSETTWKRLFLAIINMEGTFCENYLT